MRLLVLLFAMLLVAAPADGVCAETVDASAEMSVGDVLLAQVSVVTTEPEGATLFTPRREAAVPVAPAMAGIFRPPRAAIA